jgi:hypothetical protein
MQDQRIELASVLVGDEAQPPPKGPTPVPESSSLVPLHNAEQLGRVASDGAHDVRTCVAASESKDNAIGIAGDLVVHLEIDAAGLVLGGTTDPRGGEVGLAAVADCLLAAARQWKFPGRATPGSTVLVIPYSID